MRIRDNVFERSPLDSISGPVPNDAVLDGAQSAPVQARWKPSRFNVQATTAEGWLLLWNTYTGAMNAFRPAKRETILGLISRKGTAGSGGISGYFAQRGYLVPAEADELRRVQYAFGQENHRSDRLELILLPSEDCNFRCTYCYESFRRGTMRPEVREGIKKLVESRAGSLRELTVGWFGGEPLYGMEAIDDLAPYFAEIAERAGIDYFSHITTNAYLLTGEVVDRLLAWRITDFQITLDGLPEDHDRHRPRRDGGTTFQTIYDNLARMSERDDEFSVVIRVNFAQSNVPGLEKFLELLRARFSGDDRFTLSFHAVGRWGGDNDANLDVCGTGEAQAVRMRLKAAARALGLRVTSGWRPGAALGTQVCYAVRPYNFIIGAHGDLMKCTVDLDKKDRNLVGKLRPDGTLDLDVDKMALWTEPAFERDTGCQSCHMLPACQGVHCPQIRMDHDKAPCPGVRRTAKREMIDYFQAKQAAEAGPGSALPGAGIETADAALR
ncbi:radical SAM protein [Sphingomonas gei]|uniref:Radical SAM protein n=1 Tax=Sphingomonas gei TaxID=1395960 RepID=A0A4S1XAD9_9SPHN|nr:radical SAM protein [Sphingomonas gei]TGX52427.1 radical SAM protein [Sphingomonas gei]